MTVRCRVNGSYAVLSNDEFVSFALRGDIDGIDPDKVFVTGLAHGSDERSGIRQLASEVRKACPPGNGEKP